MTWRNKMKCINKECPCGGYAEDCSGNCSFYPVCELHKCSSYISAEMQKTVLTCKELLEQGARYIHTKTNYIYPISFDVANNRIIWGFCDQWYSIEQCKENDFKWSTDGLTLNSFDVEE